MILDARSNVAAGDLVAPADVTVPLVAAIRGTSGTILDPPGYLSL